MSLKPFVRPSVLWYIGSMRQGTGNPAEQLKVFLTGLVNPCTMDFVSAKGSTLGGVIYCHVGCMNYFILAKIGNDNQKAREVNAEFRNKLQGLNRLNADTATAIKSVDSTGTTAEGAKGN